MDNMDINAMNKNPTSPLSSTTNHSDLQTSLDASALPVLQMVKDRFGNTFYKQIIMESGY